MPFFLALGLTWMIYPFFIQTLKKMQIAQHVSVYAIESYKQKERTPIFGGVVFLLVGVVATVFALFPNIDVSLISVMVHMLLFASIGLVDDIKIIKEGKNDGLSGKTRLFLQTLFAISFVMFTLDNSSIQLFSYTLSLPSYVLIPARVFMIVGSINAFNITDGMDGLSAGLSVFVFAGLYIIALNEQATSALFILAMIGAMIGFLRFNIAPAKIIMGDVGSYGLGGVLIMLGLVLGKDLVFIVLYAVYLVEVLCVIIQQVAVRVFKRRVFSYTPIHYAFVLKGMKDQKVIFMFYGYGFLSLVIGLLLYALGA
ncbi:MAG: phospho-N-acetylmuramoyl-pentapeptide-transferase [Erysipelothrix sp.]|nr:phospho-N-acetylmuramoyl-pentapeptide-transferase [Erysipelothrix sp.]